jgi:hypothetical protein
MASEYDTTNGFPVVNTLSIDATTFIKWDSPPASTNSVSPSPGKIVPIINATKTIDSVHDELGKEGKNAKPTDWEDKVIEYTQTGTTPPLLIPESLNTYAKCVISEDAQSVDEGRIPYTIPNNNEFCYIKDCFPGACVPGLNNLLDQSAASLKSFFEQTGSPGFTNPLKGGGGIGQQLMIAKPDDTRLQHTAYFNYDLLMFRYIIDFFKNIGIIAIDEGELNTIYNKIITSPMVLYTPKEIQIINSVNLNYLWAYLMIFCKESVEEDPYLGVAGSQVEYYNMLNQLSQIRFDGFMVNGDGYISNPIFYYRGMEAYYMISADTATFIDTFCNTIYQNVKGEVKFQQNADNTTRLAGGVQYTTSQSMAATCISSIMGKLKSVVCRNSDNKDPIKNACMQEISRLMGNKQQSPSGWSILKFSGDTSHIVFGEIMEWIKNKYSLQFQINYLLSERPLAGRLLSAGKTIMMVSTNVFMKNFTGKGSENKNHRRAAFYITFDKSISYRNIIEGLYEKINNVRKDNNQYRLALASDLIQSLQTPSNDTVNFSDKANYLSGVTNVQLQSNPTIDNIGDQDMSGLNQIMNNSLIVDFLQAYEVDELTNKLNSITSDFETLGQNLIGRRLMGVRIGSKSNWKFLISELYDRERNPQADVNIIVQQYDNIRQIMSLSSLLSNKLGLIGPFLNDSFNKFKTNQGFNAIFSKIVKSYGDLTKLNKFEDERIADWLNNKKGESQKIPSSVELIIQELKHFIVDCLKVNKNLTAPVKITGGGNTTINNKQSGGDPSLVVGETEVFLDDFEDTLSQSMITYNVDKSIDYSEIRKMVSDFVEWRQTTYSVDMIKSSITTIQRKADIYEVLSNRVLLLSGLLDVSDASFLTHIQNNFEFVIHSYVELGFPKMKINKELFQEIILRIETSLNTKKTFNQIDKLSKYYNYIQATPDFISDVQTEYPLIFDNFPVVFSSLYEELKELVDNITTIVLTDDINGNISTIILYLQKYNRIMAKYQLLQPYKESENSVRTTILDRIVHKAVTIFGIIGGKKTKKRRKNSRKKKGSKKTKKHKKRRTIKKNRKN